MRLSKIDTEKVAHLARLDISQQEKESITKDLDNILLLIDRMNKEDTSEVPPLAHPLDATQPLRPDQVTESNQRDLLQQNAPLTHNGLFIVPAVIDNET